MINSSVISLINIILRDNTGVRNKLARYSGYSFSLNGVILPISAVIDIDGFFAPTSDNIYNTEINFNLNSYYKALSGDKLAILSSIDIIGDREFAIGLLTLFSDVNLYVTQAKSPLLLLAIQTWLKINHHIYNRVNSQLSYFIQATNDYINYEKKTVAHSVILDRFYMDVDKLNEDYNRVLAKFNSLI